MLAAVAAATTTEGDSMPLLGLSLANAKLAKWLVRAAGEVIPAGLAWLGSDLAANAEAPSTLEWRRFVLRWSRATPTGTTEDLAQFKLDLVNVTSDELDTTWTSGDYAAVAARYATFRTAITAKVSADCTWKELRAYRMQFATVPDVKRPFADSGPPTYVAALSGSGSGSASMPYQVAPTVTFRTPWAKHWGRAYLPTPSYPDIGQYGRLASAYLAAVQPAVKTLLGGLHDDGFYPVVPVGQVDKQPFHGLLGISAVVMDDVPDIQRRRRPRQVSVRQGP